MEKLERDLSQGTDDIFSTPVAHQYATDDKPGDPLLDRASYNYDLPEERIAQVPLEDRAASKMLVLDRYTGEFNDFMFRDLPSFLNEGDVLVVNNTKVIPARVFGTFQEGPGIDPKAVELLLIRPEGGEWKVMLNQPVPDNHAITFENFGSATVLRHNDDNSYQLKFNEDVWALLDKVGHTPLPPYIKNQEELEKNGIADRYNTVYSKDMTSVAAPTAGLHFTPEIIKQLEDKGVIICNVRLDVGLGTFRPVVVNDIRNHHMHTEHIVVEKSVIETINKARANGKRVISVGTTSIRTLQSIPQEIWDNPADFESDTSIFIHPGKRNEILWRVDGLFTNFHAPESTLMMLVSTFAGYTPIMTAYEHAVKENYRFLSLGDCMLII